MKNCLTFDTLKLEKFKIELNKESQIMKFPLFGFLYKITNA